MSNYHRKGRRRLTLDIPEDLYMTMLINTKERHVTVTKWVISAIIEQLKLLKGERSERSI